MVEHQFSNHRCKYKLSKGIKLTFRWQKGQTS
jgi:hypothetical protein